MKRVERRLTQVASAATAVNKGREILEYGIYIALGVILALIIRTWVFCPVRVDGWSMEPTLYQNNLMLITPSSYKMHAVDRYDIVVLKRPETQSTLLVKRVIGLPGERVEITGGKVYINGELLSSDIYGAEPLGYDMGEITVPEGSVFVLGDNRNQSTDSHILGCIAIDDIRGKVQVCLIPWKQLYA